MIEIANEVEARLRDEGFKKPLKIAIMGCVVNGPGEASDADIGIAGGKDEALLFIRGEKIPMLKGELQSPCQEPPTAVALRHAPAGAAPRRKPCLYTHL